MRRVAAARTEVPSPLRATAAAVVVGLLATLLAGCGWGVAEPVTEQVVEAPGRDTSSTAPVLRYVAAPTASPASTLPDPRCRAARRLFLRAAVASAPPPFVVDDATERRLAQAEVLAVTDQARADFAAVRDFLQRFRDAPASLTGADLEASAQRMDRMLLWTVTVCPPPQRPVWGCSTQVTYGSPDPFDGLYFVVVGQPSPDVAIDEMLGEVTGRRVELIRDQNRVVYGWLDVFGLVRRRVEVRRLYDLWFVIDAKRCDDQVERAHPFDTGEVIVEELPDAGDGPEYAPTTVPPAPETSSTTTTTTPLEPCGYDPADPDTEYESLGDYMATGPAEPGCWSRLSEAGRACVADPPAGKFFDCFDL